MNNLLRSKILFFLLRRWQQLAFGQRPYYFGVIIETETNSFGRHVERILGSDRSGGKGFRSGKGQKFQIFYCHINKLLSLF